MEYHCSNFNFRNIKRNMVYLISEYCANSVKRNENFSLEHSFGEFMWSPFKYVKLKKEFIKKIPPI